MTDKFREGKCQTACKPGSVRPLTERDDHSSGTHLAMRLTRPTRAAGRERPRDYHGFDRDIAAAPIRSCSRWGLPCRPCCQGRGALLPHRFALARGTGRLHRPSCAGGLFSVALSLGSPPPAVSRHRIPVEPGLSSTDGLPRQQRPSSCLARRICASGRGGQVRHDRSRATPAWVAGVPNPIRQSADLSLGPLSLCFQ